MNCSVCQTAVPPAFVAAIKQNICPACGGQVLSEEDHESLRRLATNLLSAGLDGEDSSVKIAAALFDKFDVFPKGVVIDNVVQKEVIYLREPAPMQMAYPQMPPYGYQQLPYGPPAAPPKRTGPQLATRKPQDERMAQIQAAAREESESENDELITDQTYDEPEEEYAVRAARLRGQGPPAAQESEVFSDEAERLARNRMAKLRAKKAGIV